METLKIKLYIDWNNHIILTEKEREKLVKKGITAIDMKLMEENFFEWLNDNYSADEIYSMDEEEKNEVETKYKTECAETELEIDYPFLEGYQIITNQNETKIKYIHEEND